MPIDPANLTAPPIESRRRIERLIYERERREKRSIEMAKEFAAIKEYLDVAGDVTTALEQLSEQLFQQLLNVVQEKLTIALQETLDQPIEFKASADFKRGSATVEFWVQRNQEREDVLRGQGGSVANVLSVGLRMFALTTLSDERHRRFLVLDEQDCWLRPDLVPKLVKIVHDAGKALGFQVLMISHHDTAMFERYADRIYAFVPNSNGSVDVKLWSAESAQPDA
jgi:ABC-type branched-subunit amino acid transport system ATPase component